MGDQLEEWEVIAIALGSPAGMHHPQLVEAAKLIVAQRGRIAELEAENHRLRTTDVVAVDSDAEPIDALSAQTRFSELEAELAQLREANRWIPVEERLPERPGA